MLGDNALLLKIAYLPETALLLDSLAESIEGSASKAVFVFCLNGEPMAVERQRNLLWVRNLWALLGRRGLLPSAVPCSLSLSQKLSFGSPGAYLFESLYSFERATHYEECIASYFPWGGDVFALTFLSLVDISVVPSKHSCIPGVSGRSSLLN